MGSALAHRPMMESTRFVWYTNGCARDEIVKIGSRDSSSAKRCVYPGIEGPALWSQDIYFRLLESGIRIPPTAASASGEMPNPVGYNRVLRVPRRNRFSVEAWWSGLRAGRVTVGNGALLQPWVEGRTSPVTCFVRPRGLPCNLSRLLSLSYRGQEPIRYIEMVRNGEVVYSLTLKEYAERQGKLLPLEFRTERLVSHPCRERGAANLPLHHDGAVLCGDRRQATGESSCCPVLPGLGLRAGSTDTAERCQRAGSCDCRSPPGTGLLAGSWSTMRMLNRQNRVKPAVHHQTNRLFTSIFQPRQQCGPSVRTSFFLQGLPPNPAGRS